MNGISCSQSILPLLWCAINGNEVRVHTHTHIRTQASMNTRAQGSGSGWNSRKCTVRWYIHRTITTLFRPVAFKYDQFTLGAKFQRVCECECECACVYMWSLRAINCRNIHNPHAKRHTESHTIRDNNAGTHTLTHARTLQIHLGFQFLSGMALHLREIPLYLKRLVGWSVGCLGRWWCSWYLSWTVDGKKEHSINLISR